MTPRQVIERAQHFFRDELWDPAFRNDAGTPDSARPLSRRLLRGGLGLLQFAAMTAEGFVRDQLLLRATALSYFTVLSLIPIIAIIVAIAGAIGIDSSFEEQIVERVAAGAPGAQAMIVDLVRNARFSALGGVGAAVLLLTTVMGISNVERSFNSIWGVTRPRSLGRRFPDYLAILLLVPLMATGLSIATGLKSQWLVQELLAFPAFATLYDVGLHQLPWLVLSLAFALMFWFLPNTSVRFTSALLGGAISGILVVIAQDTYVGYSIGVARADVLFGAFAQLPLLFLWIYIFWAIVLFGAEVAFAHQHLASYRKEVQGGRAGPAEREAIALRVALQVGEAFRDAEPPPTADDLSDALRIAVRAVRDIADHLERAGILAQRVTPDGEAYSLGRPAERIRVSDVLAALRGGRHADSEVAIERVCAELDDAIARGPGARTLADLLGDAAMERGDPGAETRAESESHAAPAAGPRSDRRFEIA